MSELQVNTIRPVSGTTLTVTNDTNLTVSGSGRVTTPLVEASDLDINGTSSLELKFNNATKLAVTSTGATVTGTMTATTFSGDGSGLTGITSAGTGGTSSVGNLQLISNSGGANGARDIVFLDRNSEKARLYGATGDFAVDTDTLYVKASNDRVGIGTTSPTSTLDVDGTCTATAFVGPVTGNVTGNLTGTVLTAAQPNVTSLGTLTSASVNGPLAVTGATSLDGNLAVTGTLTAGVNTWPQCVQTHVDYRLTYANGTTGPAGQINIAALNTTITPRSASSKILVNFSLSYESLNDRLFRLYRNIGGTRTEIASARPTSSPSQYNNATWQASIGFKSVNYDVDHASTQTNQHLMYLDAPNTTQPVTYELWTYYMTIAQPPGNWQYLVLNATINQDVQSWAHELATSQCILQEYFA